MLELGKILIHEFTYDYAKLKFGKKQICIIFINILQKMLKLYLTNYELGRLLLKGKKTKSN